MPLALLYNVFNNHLKYLYSRKGNSNQIYVEAKLGSDTKKIVCVKYF